MNLLRVIGGSANVFFLAFLTGSLAKDGVGSLPLPAGVVIFGAIILYGLAIASLYVQFEQSTNKIRLYSLTGHAVGLIIFAAAAVTYALPAMRQGIVLLTLWCAANVLALGFGDDLAMLSWREARRRAVQKRKLDLLRTKNPNETDTKS